MIAAGRVGKGCLVIVAVVSALTSAACLVPRSVACSDGRICPEGTRCDVSHHRCVSGEQASACAGHDEGASCAVGGVPGECHAGACDLLRCGDGVVTGLESCDGAPPSGKTCLDYGFDRGLLGCSSICGTAFDDCAYFGWSTIHSDPKQVLQAIWGSGPDDIFAVGDQVPETSDRTEGVIWHWNGTEWSEMHPGWNGNLGAVWGSGPNDVYAVGTEILHWDGTRWATVPSGTTAYLNGVWGSGPNDVYAVGLGTILHWDGSRWQVQESGGATGHLAVWGSSPSDVFVVGGHDHGEILHWDGHAWTSMATGATVPFSAVWGSGPDDVFAVGFTGEVFHWDGSAWAPRPTGQVGSALEAVWGSGPSDLFTAGDAVLHWDGGGWSSTALRAGQWVTGIWGSAPDDVFAVGPGILHLADTVHSTDLADLGVSVHGVWASMVSEDAFGVGWYSNSDSGAIVHWDGRRWSVVNPTVPLPSLSSIWGRAPDDLFVTTVGTIFRVSGDSWEVSLSDPAANFEAVWGSGVADVFAVGNQGTVAGSEGTIAHWDGRSWAQMPWSTTKELRGVWGTEPNDVYAVGTEGAIVHWDGRSWSAMSSGTTTTLNAVGGTGPNDVYAVGYDGTIVHWNGRDWSPLESGVKANLFAVGAGGRGDVFICGDQSLLHARAGTFEPMNLPTTTICSGLAVTPRQVIAVGYGVTLLERSTVTCVGPERYCDDGWDNDCDGLVDGADPDCAGKAFEHCANLVDDDGDGLVDCADPDCASFPGCGGRP